MRNTTIQQFDQQLSIKVEIGNISKLILPKLRAGQILL